MCRHINIKEFIRAGFIPSLVGLPENPDVILPAVYRHSDVIDAAPGIRCRPLPYQRPGWSSFPDFPGDFVSGPGWNSRAAAPNQTQGPATVDHAEVHDIRRAFDIIGPRTSISIRSCIHQVLKDVVHSRSLWGRC